MIFRGQLRRIQRLKYLVPHFIEKTFEEKPDAPAIKQGARTFIYGEIDAQSRRFQRFFHNLHLEQTSTTDHPGTPITDKTASSLFEKPQDKPVGILSRVRAEAIAAMIGALRAGQVYVPLNILAPAEWLGNVIKSAGIEVLLIDSAFLNIARELASFGIKTIVVLDDDNETDSRSSVSHTKASQSPPNVGAGQPMDDGNSQCALASGNSGGLELIALCDIERLNPDASDLPPSSKLADDIAYILYTSGSTGNPKGILITHRNAFTFIDWMRHEFALQPDDRVFNRAPLQFDLSVFDIFSTFAAGATLLITPMNHSKNADDVVSFVREERATIVYTVPSTFINWLSHGNLERGLPDLRLILYAGEPFPLPYLKRLSELLPHVQISNIYGPTETNIVTYYHLYGPGDIKPEWESVPIGKVVHDTEAFIVDEDLNMVPEGEKGEILIRGGTVFAGYFKEPELTKKRLIQSPFHNYPTLCCRTGDLGRRLPDGNIIYHGRADSMVKTRGYRVEIGEVESALSSIAGIDELAVIPRPHEKYGNTLHAFVSCSKDGPSAETIEAKLKEKIPAYMVPYEFIVQNGLPKTSTGKIDRVTLKEKLNERSLTEQ